MSSKNKIKWAIRYNSEKVSIITTFGTLEDAVRFGLFKAPRLGNIGRVYEHGNFDYVYRSDPEAKEVMEETAKQSKDVFSDHLL